MGYAALATAVVPWGIPIFFGSFIVLLVAHLKHGVQQVDQEDFPDGYKTKHFSEEEFCSWANGYFKLLRWISGLVGASSAAAAGIVWAFMDDKQFPVRDLFPANVSAETREAATELVEAENGCVGPPGVCAFGWGVTLVVGVIMVGFHVNMLRERINGKQQGNTWALVLCGVCQSVYMGLVFLWKTLLPIGSTDEYSSLWWIDTFTNIATALIFANWFVRAAFMFKYGLLWNGCGGCPCAGMDRVAFERNFFGNPAPNSPVPCSDAPQRDSTAGGAAAEEIKKLVPQPQPEPEPEMLDENEAPLERQATSPLLNRAVSVVPS